MIDVAPRARPADDHRPAPAAHADAAIDAALVARLRDGDRRAGDELHHRHQRALLGHARRTLGRAAPDLAEEVVQDAWLRGLVALRRDDRPIAFRPWMCTIVRNRCLDRLRGRRPVALEPFEGTLADPVGDVAGTVAARERLRSALSALDGLPPRQRAAFVGHVVRGVPHERVAAGLGTTVPATKTLVSRARTSLAAA